MTLSRWLILFASIILFAGALLHMLGAGIVLPLLVKAGVEPRIVGAVKCVWLVFSSHGILLAPAYVWISRRSGLRSLLLYLSLIPVIDCMLMYHFVGLFIGTYMVATGSLLLVIGAWLLPHQETSVA